MVLFRCHHVKVEKSLSDLTLVLDLDETLVHSISKNGSEREGLKVAEKIGIYTKPEYKDIAHRSYRIKLYDPVTPKGTGVVYGCWGVVRPYAIDFLQFAFTYFKYVIIWSAGVTEYVDEICTLLSRDLRPFDIIFTRIDCVIVDGVCTKPLRKLLKKHPELGDLSKILIVDDKLDGCLDNIDNAIIIPPYNPSYNISAIRANEDALIKLQLWFETDEVMLSDDVRKLDKSKIFT